MLTAAGIGGHQLTTLAFNASVATLGVAKTPAYNSEVAIFTNISGGLMVEGSIGGHYYHYKALPGQEP